MKTKLKGWLTNISLGTVISGMVMVQTELLPVFIKASNIELSLVSVTGLLGAIWGISRKFTKAYKES